VNFNIFLILKIYILVVTFK